MTGILITDGAPEFEVWGPNAVLTFYSGGDKIRIMVTQRSLGIMGQRGIETMRKLAAAKEACEVIAFPKPKKKGRKV